MFSLRRIIRDRKPVTNYISTSNIIRSDESKKLDDESKKSIDEPEKENQENLIPKEETSPHSSRVSAFFSNVKKEIKSKPKESSLNITLKAETKLSKITEFDKSSDESRPPSKAQDKIDFFKKAIRSSAEEITENTGGDKKGTKIDTSDFIRTISGTKSSKRERPPKSEHKVDFFKKAIEFSVEELAGSMGGDKKETKRDLLDYIKTFEVSKEKPEAKEFFLESGSAAGGLMWTISKIVSPTNIFGRYKNQNWGEQVELSTWQALEAEHLEYVARKPPSNYFEELIQWTNEGRLWHFPIDNDQGREKEGEVSFTEHIFLEQNLEPWCPKRGPLRRFMELVLIGLAKNPHLSVEDKKEHIAWFQKYFESKKKLLQELGAVGSTKQIEVSNQENS